jgi:hypothetical protein
MKISPISNVGFGNAAYKASSSMSYKIVNLETKCRKLKDGSTAVAIYSIVNGKPESKSFCVFKELKNNMFEKYYKKEYSTFEDGEKVAKKFTSKLYGPGYTTNKFFNVSYPPVEIIKSRTKELIFAGDKLVSLYEREVNNGVVTKYRMVDIVG